MTDEDYQAQLARELEWVVRSKQAVAAGTPLFMKLLSAEDRRFREMSALLLGLTRCVVPLDDVSVVEVIERIQGIES